MDSTPRQADEIVRDYIAAFEARDLARCIAFFTDDASVDFAASTYHGRQELENWHAARFAANLTLVRIDSVTWEGTTVTVKGAITSDKAKKWHLDVIRGHTTFQIREGKIGRLCFSLL